ncbi:MAG: DUF3429 domain-containing protein [Sphingomonadaceae bacterium]
MRGARNSRADIITMTMTPFRLPRVAYLLGFAGLVPQALALGLTFSEDSLFIGLAAGFFYAALIFSFLGGIWWGVAATSGDAPTWLYPVAVVPSLLAFASGVPWMNGSAWPGPSLAVLGVGILLSPSVDFVLMRLGVIDRDLFGLRVLLSLGLGLLTMALAVAAPA